MIGVLYMSLRYSIIVINDNTDILNLFKEALQHERIETYAFNDPKPAMEKIRTNPALFSLVVINFGSMMKKSHRRFARTVKSINRDIKITLTSSYDSSPVDLDSQGYDAYVKIPVPVGLLVNKVKEVLSAGQFD